jgi:hypothetical protein
VDNNNAVYAVAVAAAVYAVYEFVAGAESLEARYLQASNGVPLSEPALWSIFIQLSTALRAIHAAGFAARSVDSSKVPPLPSPLSAAAAAAAASSSSSSRPCVASGCSPHDGGAGGGVLVVLMGRCWWSRAQAG